MVKSLSIANNSNITGVLPSDIELDKDIAEAVSNAKETCMDKLKKDADYITHEEEALCTLEDSDNKNRIEKSMAYSNLAIVDQLKEINRTLKMLVERCS